MGGGRNQLWQANLPKIPANATLIFEVELISWVRKNDLLGDRLSWASAVAYLHKERGILSLVATIRVIGVNL